MNAHVQDIREIKQAIQDLAIVTAKLNQAVESNKENQAEIIKELKQYVKEEKQESMRMRAECRKELHLKYDRHSEAITEHGKEIARMDESIKGIGKIASVVAIVVTSIFNVFFGLFR